ncbi:hypothetical protein [Rheinheimera soli]|uniref:Transmembrane protein n=1 Tax=Rheinheimera soli TaxID=443616 RepID=A0ABU1W4V0_9GAMM|nr:hypothetical protein [Rheinheimera soli]MDR7122982.1 hypothetical protein [Rheinheimera soli]
MSYINQSLDPVREQHAPSHLVDRSAGNQSAVSWAAIFAGAAGAAALSLLLMILGTGLGFSAVSPWSMEGISATSFGVAAIVWLSFTQLAASGMGGYLAGRLRTKWTDLHTDEVYFRDTAHGFLTWAVASLLTAVIMTSVVSAVGSGMRASAEMVGGAAGAVAGTAAGSAATMAASEDGSGDNKNALGYFVDSLFRADAQSSTERITPQANQPSPDVLAGRVASQTNELTPEAQAQGTTAPANEPAPQVQTERTASRSNGSDQGIRDIPAGEVTRIFARALYAGELPEEDQSYIAQLIAQQTDLSQQDAEQRVSEGFDKVKTMLKNAETTARETADEARKASAYAALWMAVALLFGAFIASLMAVYGGRQRDA